MALGVGGAIFIARIFFVILLFQKYLVFSAEEDDHFHGVNYTVGSQEGNGSYVTFDKGGAEVPNVTDIHPGLVVHIDANDDEIKPKVPTNKKKNDLQANQDGGIEITDEHIGVIMVIVIVVMAILLCVVIVIWRKSKKIYRKKHPLEEDHNELVECDDFNMERQRLKPEDLQRMELMEYKIEGKGEEEPMMLQSNTKTGDSGEA
ncbi:uncharacterized protein LOC106167575 [Lingula anatina]|uniref:Uncharacterized protein LOC106167575 n=1 Tax=Lingula anatina TaxID=7574 RepID=A0A1S3IUE5_LINAN|nr:uncharacterized protein LOC106167575 [Lingula anatina]|eukprot:XP_013401830.1 uncharacterized protein LOC106167575 [Lingula anatina]